MAKFCPTTGALYEHIADIPECQEFLTVFRTGLKFRAAQSGRHPGEVSKLVEACARRAAEQPCSFDALLVQLHAEALKRERDGERASIVEKVDYTFQLVTLHTKQGRIQISFATLRSHLTKARKLLENKK